MDLWTLSDLATPWCVHVVATLRIANHIEAGHTSVAGLAAATQSDADYLGRVLRHLLNKGLFEEPQPGHFALNDLARGLLGDVSGFDLDSFGGRMANAWSTLLTAVRTGKPAYHEAFGRPFWQDLEANPKISASFDQLMSYAGHGTPDPNVLPDPEAWNEIKTVVDVGGGTGALLAEILRAHPGVTGTLVDLARVVDGAKQIFAAAGVSDRANAIGQSFFDPLPAGADLYTLKSVLADWPDQEARSILARCAEAARSSGGRIVVFTNTGPGQPAAPELLMLLLLGGKDRAIEELRQLGSQAGLDFRSLWRQPSGKYLVEFVPSA
jgi:hypothetical protein